MSDNFNIDLKKFAENAKKIKKAKEDFETCLNAEITELEVAKDKLFQENEQAQIYSQLAKLDINIISVPKVGRVQTILDFVSQEYLAKYRNHFLTNYSHKDLPETPKRPESSDKAIIQQFNETVKKWQEEVKLIKDWNTKYNVLTEYLDSIITIDLYGDTTLNVTNLPYVYFKFLNTDIDEIEVFMQELKTCPAPPVKKIKSIRIEDIKDKLPAFVKSAKEVRVYLENDQDANELHGSADYVGGVYEKYVIKNDLMKKDGGEWGLYNQRKDNLNNPTIGSFNLQSVPTPVNLNSGQAYEPEEDFYKDNYEVTLSECLYAEAEVDGITVFAIVPKEFWEKYKTVLVNKKMKIDGVTDNQKFVRKEIYFQFLGDTSDAYATLDDAEYSHELSDYMDDYGNTSPFKRKLKELLGVKSFDSQDWDRYANWYELSDVDGIPTTEHLINKLSDKDKQSFYEQNGVNSKKQYEDEIGYEDQDFENCDLVYLNEHELEVRCGGDWQAPAVITFGLKGNDIVVTDYHFDDFDVVDTDNDEDEEEYNGSSIQFTFGNDEDEEEVNEENDEYTEYLNSNPSDCYWAIDCMNNLGEFSLIITPKKYWDEKKTIYSDEINFDNKLVNKYNLSDDGDGNYFLYDKNSNDVLSLHIIAKVMKDSGFVFNRDIQNELPTVSLNGLRIKFSDINDELFFQRASAEFAEYLYNLSNSESESDNISDDDYEDDIEDGDFGDSEDELEYNSASDFIWAVNVMEDENILFGKNHLLLAITPKQYWKDNQCLSDAGGEGSESFIIRGYELDEECESQFSLRYANLDKYVTKLSELKLVMDKSGFEYSWEMQNFLDNNYSLVDSNKYNTQQQFFDALKVAMGQ